MYLIQKSTYYEQWDVNTNNNSSFCSLRHGGVSNTCKGSAIFFVPLLISFNLQTLEIDEKMCKNTYKSVFEVNILKSSA